MYKLRLEIAILSLGMWSVVMGQNLTSCALSAEMDGTELRIDVTQTSGSHELIQFLIYPELQAILTTLTNNNCLDKIGSSLLIIVGCTISPYPEGNLVQVWYDNINVTEYHIIFNCFDFPDLQNTYDDQVGVFYINKFESCGQFTLSGGSITISGN